MQACSSGDAQRTTNAMLEDGDVNGGNQTITDNPLNDDPGAQPMITLENYQSVVANVFFYINGRYPSETGDNHHRIFYNHSVIHDDFPVEELAYGSREVINCQNGGTLDASVLIHNTGYQYTFDNCLIPSLNAIHQGSLETLFSKYETKRTYDNLQTFSTEGTLRSRAVGFLQERRPNTPFCGAKPYLLRKYDDLYLLFSEGKHTLSDAEITYHLSDPLDADRDCGSRVEADFKFTFEASVSSDQNYSVEVSTPTPLYGAGKNITEGKMLITATDGSSIELDVLENDSDMIHITISNAERVDEIVEPKSYLMNHLIFTNN